MKKANQKIVEVYGDWAELNEPVLIGLLHATPMRGKEVFGFEYDANWLKHPLSQEIDPELSLFSGPHYPNPNKSNFGIFLDSSPDRWGAY